MLALIGDIALMDMHRTKWQTAFGSGGMIPGGFENRILESMLTQRRCGRPRAFRRCGQQASGSAERWVRRLTPLEELADMSPNFDVDRNLLFAVIALQDDLIDQTQFADVCAGWAVRLERPLAELLLDRGWIKEQDRQDVERKLERKLKKHRGDIRATLGAVAGIEARDILQVIDNPQVRQSLAGLAPARGHVLVETLLPTATQRDTTALYTHAGACRRAGWVRSGSLMTAT